MLDETELETFKKNYFDLMEKASNYLRNEKWLDKVDRYVSIKVIRADSTGVWFELFHTMINRIEESEHLSWAEINNLK